MSRATLFLKLQLQNKASCLGLAWQRSAELERIIL